MLAAMAGLGAGAAMPGNALAASIEPESAWDAAKRNISAGTRATLEGNLGAPNALINMALPEEWQLGNPGEALSDFFGLAKPQNAQEEAASNIVRGMADALPYIATGAGMAKYGTGLAQAAGRALASAPGTDMALGGITQGILAAMAGL